MGSLMNRVLCGGERVELLAPGTIMIREKQEMNNS